MAMLLERQISAAPVVEWRVFIPLKEEYSHGLHGTPLGTIFASPMLLEQVEEQRSDIYTVIDEDIGLKRRVSSMREVYIGGRGR